MFSFSSTSPISSSGSSSPSSCCSSCSSGWSSSSFLPSKSFSSSTPSSLLSSFLSFLSSLSSAPSSSSCFSWSSLLSTCSSNCICSPTSLAPVLSPWSIPVPSCIFPSPSPSPSPSSSPSFEPQYPFANRLQKIREMTTNSRARARWNWQKLAMESVTDERRRASSRLMLSDCFAPAWATAGEHVTPSDSCTCSAASWSWGLPSLRMARLLVSTLSVSAMRADCFWGAREADSWSRALTAPVTHPWVGASRSLTSEGAGDVLVVTAASSAVQSAGGAASGPNSVPWITACRLRARPGGTEGWPKWAKTLPQALVTEGSSSRTVRMSSGARTRLAGRAPRNGRTTCWAFALALVRMRVLSSTRAVGWAASGHPPASWSPRKTPRACSQASTTAVRYLWSRSTKPRAGAWG
mmetsp:Transcript_81884/g.144555  ORF Transcript_81884/g.144555 Transcript_81884/m.144555 type:complete len:409 (-) Transcript_81884:2882-4108(-)